MNGPDRCASPAVPAAEGGWTSVGPTSEPFGRYAAPEVLDEAGIAAVVAAFAESAVRADHAGFDVVELHAAHGYLLHEFLSPLVNTRTDGYGGDLAGRARLLLEVASAVRAAWPERKPLFVRVSATDWVQGGWDGDATVELARLLAGHGVDLVDCSTGGAVPDVSIPAGPGYQVAFAERVRREAGVPSGAVGMITEPAQAQRIVSGGQADAVLLARALLRDPRWVQRAAAELGAEVPWPSQYLRARPA